MLLTNRTNKYISIAAFLLAILSRPFAGEANEQDQQANGIISEQQITRLSSSTTKYNVPFLLLMSSKEISVAQLPLIDNGNISVVYRLTDSPDSSSNSSQEKEEDEEGEEEAKVMIADAREYEQQMPQSTILGKFEWQQQTAGNAAASVSSSKFISGQEEVATRKAVEQLRGGSNQEVKRPRRRRSIEGNNLTDDQGNSSGGSPRSSGSSNGTMDGNNNSSRAYAVMESSSSSNVTSAQFSTREEGRGDSPEGGDEDGDKNAASFNDFDVHMAYGYAFVSDSSGRIHKFRLSGFDGGNPNLKENDYTDTIDAASKQGTKENSIRTTERDFIPLNSNRDDATASNHESGVFHDGGSDSITDDANKVSPGNVVHRQSGRHPPASGSSGTLSKGSVENVTVDSSSGGNKTPSSNNLKSGNNYSNHRKIDSKPRIIWSRMKHDFSTVAHPAQQYSVESTLRKGAKFVGGAFPQQPGELVAVGGGGSSSDNQMANEAEHQHMVGAKGEDPQSSDYRDEPGAFGESEQTSAAAAADPSAIKLQQQRKANRKLQTEIAVDWLNNLLFVLDKYRLLVVDFDGNNELVLIDDFNINNRPIDIKVDPINCFLFWLQVGTFHNTIYKLDLGILSKDRGGNTLKLTGQSVSRVEKSGASGQIDSSSELLALISHHYAHPIITNLPQNTKLFTIDHKHSRIYVPLASATTSTTGSGVDRNKTQQDDAEVFSSSDSNMITHMNSTSNQISPDSGGLISNEVDRNCNTTAEFALNPIGQILAYNLDGTDVGPLRNDAEKSHLSGMDDMQDITLDSKRGFLYWLTNEGKELFEEYKSESDSTFYSAQHSLDGKGYLQLKHFDNGSNQPTDHRRRLILVLPTSTNRPVRSNMDRIEDNGIASSLDSRQHVGIDADVTRFSRNAPFIILGITCLVVLSVYLIYAFVFQRLGSSPIGTGEASRDGSMVGSSIGESRVECGVTPNRFLGTNTISKWIPKPSSSRSTDNSTFNREFGNEHLDSCDIESNSYNASNAIDEHYRDNQALFNLDTGLADLSEWPTNMHDMSNKLYVPVEVLQDEALSSIQRISIDQLEIERRNPLGEGHFGKVLQGTITCKINEHGSLIHHDKSHIQCVTPNPASYASSLAAVQLRRIAVPSSTSSGHGSSSTSSDFITATSCLEPTNGDYLTPKSHCTSAVSDYLIIAPMSRPESCSSDSNQEEKSSVVTIETKFKVAIKKLKGNASVEEKRDFLQEAKLLANFDHPNIVHLIGICLDRGSTLIVMELMLGGDLIRYMQENTPRSSHQEDLTNDDLLSICLDIVNGCCYLAELSYIHRDLAARNCLVSSRKKEERVVKLADFGLARDIYKDSYYKKLNDSAMPLKWMAPECLTEQKFTTMSDVWSFGVVMWEVMSYCQEKPYEGIEPFFMKGHLTSNNRLRKPENCSEVIYGLMKACWELEPENRPTFQECRAELIEIKNATRS